LFLYRVQIIFVLFYCASLSSANTSSALAREGETMKLSYMIISIFDNHVSFMIRIINDTKEDVTKMLRHIFVTS